MNRLETADVLVEAGCYINTNRNNDEPITLPDGSTVPVYLSCRRLLSNVNSRKKIEAALIGDIADNLPDADLVVGLATAGIGWAHAVASELDLPLAYVRSNKKGYGIGDLVEGEPEPESAAIVIDDVLFSGKSIFTAMAALSREKSINTIGVSSIIALNSSGVAGYRNMGINATSLTGYTELLESALQHGVLSNTERDQMLSFYVGSDIAGEPS